MCIECIGPLALLAFSSCLCLGNWEAVLPYIGNTSYPWRPRHVSIFFIIWLRIGPYQFVNSRNNPDTEKQNLKGEKCWYWKKCWDGIEPVAADEHVDNVEWDLWQEHFSCPGCRGYPLIPAVSQGPLSKSRPSGMSSTDLAVFIKLNPLGVVRARNQIRIWNETTLSD